MNTPANAKAPVSANDLAHALSRLLAMVETPKDLTEEERREAVEDTHLLLNRWEETKGEVTDLAGELPARRP